MIEKIVLTGFIFLAWIFILFFGVAFLLAKEILVSITGGIIILAWIFISVKIILEKLK